VGKSILIYYFVKILNVIPHSLKVRIAYSAFGSKIVKFIKKRETNAWFEIGNDVKLFD